MTDTGEMLAARLDDADGIAIGELHEALDAFGDDGRLAFVRSLGNRRQQRLWDLADKHMEASLDMFVGDDIAPGRTAVFEGRNSMAMFNLFQKRFTRAAEGEELWGYNHQFWGWLTGPGYFVCTKDDDTGIFVFDYIRLPAAAPDGWPALKPNQGFPAGIVYGEMIDEVRPVTRDVHIGKAFRKGKPRGQFFTLVRSMVI
jgi:hypothetical protein